MYSRNTSKKSMHQRGNNGYRSASSFPSEAKVGTVENEEGSNEKSDREVGYMEKSLPLPPPNYRGMIYDRQNVTVESIEAGGIERLVKNDASYCAEGMRRMPKKQGTKPFSHSDPPVCGLGAHTSGAPENGLEKLVNGLREKNFQPEDILICAMIMLMLNGKSEDDILMVLVLMLLL